MHWYKKAKRQCDGWICIRLKNADKKKIVNWGKNNIKDDIIFNKEGFGRELDSHVTVMYGVCNNDVEPIEKIAKQYKNIKIKLGKVGFFKGNDEYDVVIIKVISDDLHRLHKDIKKEIDVEETYPDYKPHCCIAYVKKGEANNFAGNDFIENTELTFDTIFFEDNNNKKTEIKL